MILEILRYPHPLLRKRCKAIKLVDDKTRRLIEDMIETLHAAPGVGLAAPQVGENIRLIVADIGEGAFAVINPRVIKKNKILQTYEEGCLCLPGLVGPVSRPSKITMEGLDHNGQKLIIEAEGFLATVLQHEIEHLDGIIFTDRVKDKSLLREVTRKEEEEKKEFL
jgi:peptide deformylase